MSTNGEVVINVATRLEDPERLTVAFLVAGAAAPAGQQATMIMRKEAVPPRLPNLARGVTCDGCPSLSTLAAQYGDAGGRMLVCPICLGARKLSEDDLLDGAQLGGATPLRQWIDEGATDLSYRRARPGDQR